MSDIQTPVSIFQVRELLLARGQQAARIRESLIGLLTYHAQIPRLWELSTGELVGKMLVLEETTGPLGNVIRNIIAPTRIEEPESHRAARRIMGENFFGFDEVANAFGFVSPDARAALANIPFDEATLWSCCKTHVLVPDLGFSIVDVRGYMKRRGPPLLFRYRDLYIESWYDAEAFANCTDQAAWRLIRRVPVPNSTPSKLDEASTSWAEQNALIGKDEEVPTARRVVYAIMLVASTGGERLFEERYVRTIDVVLLDGCIYRVIVGHFDNDGLCIDARPDYARCGDLGVSSSRRSNV